MAKSRPVARLPCLRAERERLLQEGFSNWTRREFNTYVRACEKYGRNALAEIAKDIEGKTEDEVGVNVMGVLGGGPAERACSVKLVQLSAHLA